MISKIKKIIADACVINTVVMTLLYVLGYVTNTDGGTAWIPKFNVMWMVLGVSFVISLAERVLEMRGNFAVRLVCHFLLCVSSFLLIFIIGGGYGSDPSSVVVGVFLFVVAYVLVNCVRFVLIHKRETAENDKEEYSDIYKK